MHLPFTTDIHRAAFRGAAILILAATSAHLHAGPRLPASDTASNPAPVAKAVFRDSANDSAAVEFLSDLEERIGVLERNLEQKKTEDGRRKPDGTPEAAGRPESAGKTETAAREGFSLVSPDKQSLLRIQFSQQADARYHFGDTARQLPNAFSIRRARPALEGTLRKHYNFRFMPEFSSSIPTLLDAYGEIAFSPEARIRVGLGKTPIGLERLKAVQDMDLIEFSHATSLAPKYDVGVSVKGDVRNGAFVYELGVFNGAPDGGIGGVERDDDKELMARAFLFPFKTSKEELLRDFGLGLAVSYGRKIGDNADTRLSEHRSEGDRVFFRYRTDPGDTVRARGTGFRINPQTYWYFSSIGILGEYILSSQQLGHGGADSALAAVTSSKRAWNATVTYVLTGETPSFRGLRPRRSMSLREESGYGALEGVLRASQIVFGENHFPAFADPALSARKAFTWTGGLNWYLSTAVKFSANYAWTTFQGGAPGGANRAPERVLFSRLQTTF